MDQGALRLQLATVTTASLKSECILRAELSGFAPYVGLNFARSLLTNSTPSRNRWRWGTSERAFFSNMLMQVGLHSYRFIASELGSPSVTTLQRMTEIDVRELLSSATCGVSAMAAHFDNHPRVPRRVILQHDGIHVRQGVV